MATIRAQHSEQRLVFQFRIDNLLAMFKSAPRVPDKPKSEQDSTEQDSEPEYEPEDDADTYDTTIFGPGLYFRVHSYRQSVADGGRAKFDLSVRASDALMEPVHAEITFRGSSRDNTKEWFSHRGSYTLEDCGDWFRWYGVLDQDTLLEDQTMLHDNAVVVMAVFKFTRATSATPILSTVAVDLLCQTLGQKELPTVRYATFSARRSDGALTKPQSVYAPRDVLVSASENIKESWEEGLALLNGKVIDPANLPSQIDGDGLDDLDVLSDFDIDEGSADDEITLASERICSKDMHHSLPQSALALTSVIDSEADITEESIDFIDDDLAGSTTPSDTGRASCKAATKELDTSQAILLKGIAHRTWQALLFYLYTGIVVFAPLSSGGAKERDAFITEYKRANPNKPTPPSCRTMYDLAMKLGLTDLRRRAFHFLRSQLTEANIIDELFSPFTCRHEPVRNMQTAFLVAHWPALKADPAFEAKFQEIARGERPYAAALIMHILRAVASADCSTLPETKEQVRWHGASDSDEDDEDDDDTDSDNYTSDGEFEFHASDDDETTTDDMDYDAEAEAAQSDTEAGLDKVEKPDTEAKSEAGTTAGDNAPAAAKAEETETNSLLSRGSEGSIVIACLVRGDAPRRS